MLKGSKLVIMVLISGFLFSCSTTYKIGKQYSTEHVSKIEIGTTSESDIKSFFGNPWKKGILNGNLVYTYSYEEIVFRRNNAVEKTGNTLIVEFDEDKNVKHYYFNIPGADPLDLSLMMHKNKTLKEEQEQVAWQNSTSTTPNH